MVGCSDFGNLNEDPNNPTQPRTDLLLTEAEKDVGTMVGTVTGTLYSQYISETQYTDDSRYSSVSFDWSYWYANNGPLQNLQTIIDLNSNEETSGESYVLAGGSNTTQLAVARILKTYYFHIITDRWGPVPYQEALQGNENLTPAYDAQSDIYEHMLSTLETANQNLESAISNGETPPTGDFLFDGDLEKWQNFANSLRMRLALRIADVNGSMAQSHFESAYDNGHLQESFMFPFLEESNNENPWFSRFRTRTDYAISNTISDTMKALNDHRLLKYADPAPNHDDGDGDIEFSDINPMPYGLSQDSAGSIPNAEISFPGMAIRQQNAPLPILTMAEIHFMLAEAAERGWNVSGSAEAHYEDGIEASWRQWEVYDSGDFTTYINQPTVQYESANWRAKIGLQKWKALFPLGYESWSEWRRLGQPELEPAPAAQNESGQIPVRHGYPGEEQNLNEDNYKNAVNNLLDGDDGLDTNVWWDVN